MRMVAETDPVFHLDFFRLLDENEMFNGLLIERSEVKVHIGREVTLGDREIRP